MIKLDDKFYYVYSSDLNNKVQIKIGTLEGKRPKPEYDKLLTDPMLKFSGLYQEGCSDLYVTCQVLSDGQPLTLPVTTSYKSFTNRWNWNEWVTLPIHFNDLPRNATLAMTIYDCAGPGKVMVVGGTTISLFGKYGMFRRGMFDLRVWPGAEGSEKTPGKAPDRGKEQMQRLAKLVKKHRNGQIPKVDWLDRLTFREIEMINEKEKRNSEYMYLMIEFMTVHVGEVEHAVVYFEEDGDEVHQFKTQPDIVKVPDCEILLENLVEGKHRRLARSLRAGAGARDAKPTAAERDLLHALQAAPAPPTPHHQDLLWKYRFYLSTHKRALTKFLECVNWNRPSEVRQALAMMKIWAPMDVEDALELLTPKFTHPAVRKYAISRLKQAPDEDLLLYLLQLVQALKYEDFNEIHEEYLRTCPAAGAHSADCAVMSASDSSSLSGGRHEVDETPAPSETEDLEEDQSLASFLISRACNNSVLGNYLYWYLSVECESGPAAAARDMYTHVRDAYTHRLLTGTAEHQRTHSFLVKQQVLVDKLVRLVRAVACESGGRARKAARLQHLLADPDHHKFTFTAFDPVPFPLDPTVTIKGIVAKKASLFKSALMPCKLTFLTTEGMEYEAIFKHGDDLRQDQLILQMITLMDKLLRRENLDLKLTPYKVLATSSRHGFLQFVQSASVAEALAADGSIHNYFRRHAPCPSAPFGVRPDTMDTYIRSCAGYCVITYILGVGDRHLDNLLLCGNGALFHIDFGYILGRDPKPLPPPMKLSREMLEAMGGLNHELYHRFRKLCYTAFLHLRRHANLMLNLFSLMVDASVPDIALEPDKAVKKVQDKLRLDLGDEEAVHYFQNLLDMSVTAVMAVLVEQLHKFAQYWRK